MTNLVVFQSRLLTLKVPPFLTMSHSTCSCVVNSLYNWTVCTCITRVVQWDILGNDFHLDCSYDSNRHYWRRFFPLSPTLELQTVWMWTGWQKSQDWGCEVSRMTSDYVTQVTPSNKTSMTSSWDERTMVILDNPSTTVPWFFFNLFSGVRRVDFFLYIQCVTCHTEGKRRERGIKVVLDT